MAGSRTVHPKLWHRPPRKVGRGEVQAHPTCLLMPSLEQTSLCIPAWPCHAPLHGGGMFMASLSRPSGWTGSPGRAGLGLFPRPPWHPPWHPPRPSAGQVGGEVEREGAPDSAIIVWTPRCAGRYLSLLPSLVLTAMQRPAWPRTPAPLTFRTASFPGCLRLLLP